MGVAMPLYGNGSQTLHTVIPLAGRGSCAGSSPPGSSTSCTCTRPTTRASSCSRRSRCPRARSASAPTTRSSRPGRLRDLVHAPTRASLSRLHGHIVVSEACIHPLDHYFPEFDWRVIPNGIDEDHFSPERAAARGAARERRARSSSSSAASTRATASASCSTRSSSSGARATATCACASSATARCGATTRGGSRPRSRASVHWAGPRRLEPPALLRVGRRLLHALPARELRHGAARGDELRPPGRREHDLGLRAAAHERARGPARRAAGRAGRVRRGARTPARLAGRAAAAWAPRAGSTATARYAWPASPASSRRYYLELRGEAPSAPPARRRARAAAAARPPHPSDTMPGVRRLASTWLPPLVWMAIIFAFSSQHGGGHLPAAEIALRKLAHVTGYLVLTLLLLRALRRSGVAPRCPSRSPRALAYAVATSGTSRSSRAARATPRDVAIDGIGIAPRGARRHAHAAAGARGMSRAIVFAERAIAPGGDAIWPLALEHLARRFASIRELDIAGRARARVRRSPRSRPGRATTSARGGSSSPLLRRPRARAPAARSRHGRAARGAARRRRAARGLRPGPARDLGHHARRSSASTGASTRSCSSPPATATPSASRRSA